MPRNVEMIRRVIFGESVAYIEPNVRIEHCEIRHLKNLPLGTTPFHTQWYAFRNLEGITFMIANRTFKNMGRFTMDLINGELKSIIGLQKTGELKSIRYPDSMSGTIDGYFYDDTNGTLYAMMIDPYITGEIRGVYVIPIYKEEMVFQPSGIAYYANWDHADTIEKIIRRGVLDRKPTFVVVSADTAMSHQSYFDQNQRNALGMYIDFVPTGAWAINGIFEHSHIPKDLEKLYNSFDLHRGLFSSVTVIPGNHEHANDCNIAYIGPMCIRRQSEMKFLDSNMTHCIEEKLGISAFQEIFDSK